MHQQPKEVINDLPDTIRHTTDSPVRTHHQRVLAGFLFGAGDNDDNRQTTTASEEEAKNQQKHHHDEHHNLTDYDPEHQPTNTMEKSQ